MASTDVDTVSAVMDQNPYESPREPSGRFVHGSGEQQPAHNEHDGKAEVTMWWKRALTIASITALCLYVGSFLLFRAFPQEFSLAHRDDPQHYIVTFADNVEVHSALRKFYWPLIQVMPGHRYYPTRDELQQARYFHEWWTSGKRPAEPDAAPDRGGR